MIIENDLIRWSYPQMKSAAPASAPVDYELLYPNIFYQIQPFVLEACDQMDACGSMMPSRETLRKMGDTIEMQFAAPDMTAMAQAASDASPEALRSRGLFRDLLDILLLNELFNRRRRYY